MSPHPWISHCDAILFDFDGLLVDTEGLHFAAFCETMARYGIQVDWTFGGYVERAHGTRWGLRDASYEEFPDLRKRAPDWEALTAERRAIYLRLVAEVGPSLMPGVEELLIAVQEAKVPACVVTHSIREHIERISAAFPILRTLSLWITREDYTEPKPAPDGYQVGLQRLGSQPGARVVGFEDSLRGIRALVAAQIPAVLVCAPELPQVADAAKMGVLHVPTFHTLMETVSLHRLRPLQN